MCRQITVKLPKIRFRVKLLTCAREVESGPSKGGTDGRTESIDTPLLMCVPLQIFLVNVSILQFLPQKLQSPLQNQMFHVVREKMSLSIPTLTKEILWTKCRQI
jgi:hypothetical protein